MLCDECDKPAEFTGVWPWGKPIKVCARHQLSTNQKATQQLDIQNGIAFSVIDPGKPVELGRDERTQLRAAILTRDDELADLQRRVTDSARANAELADEVRRLRGITEAQARDLGDARDKVERLQQERDDAKASEGHAITERDRLELIVRNIQTSPVGYPAATAGEGSGRGSVETP